MKLIHPAFLASLKLVLYLHGVHKMRDEERSIIDEEKN